MTSGRMFWMRRWPAPCSKTPSEIWETFDFIGICEYFDDSVRVLSEMLGFELSAKKLNVNPDRPVAAPTTEELDIARSLNRLDIQLYDKARSRFERIYLSRRAPGSLRSLAGAALGGSVLATSEPGPSRQRRSR